MTASRTNRRYKKNRKPWWGRSPSGDVFCKWCGKLVEEPKKPNRNLCPRCKKRTPLKKIDALDRRLPGGYGTGKRR